MTKNYYWNQGCQFPITGKDVIDGRCYMFLEAIRKLCFLLQFPAAGYYKNDISCRDGGHLLEYVAGNIYYLDDDEVAFANYTTYMAANYSGTVEEAHYQSELKIYSGGVIWAYNVASVKTTKNVYYSGARSTAPPENGWFEPNTKGVWTKHPSRNRYYEWDFNSLRNLYAGNRYQNIDLSYTYVNPGGRDYKFLPKNFDPFEVLQPKFRLPEAMQGKAKFVSGMALSDNQYYWYNLTSEGVEVPRLWKCLDYATADSPSLTSADWSLYMPEYSSTDFMFQRKEIELQKWDFFKEPIQGPQYTTAEAVEVLTHPWQAFTQYVQLSGWPSGLGVGVGEGRTLDEPKLCSTTAAYIEASLDWHSFSAEVDSDYKANYHKWCGGVYQGDSYTSYDKALEAEAAILVAPITSIFWGCNGSGFEWALKKVGDWDWYFDTSYPQYSYLQTALDEAIEAEDDDAITAINNVISTITGTWRRTWKHSIGTPQEQLNLVPSDYSLTADGCPPRPRYNDSGTLITLAAWETIAASHYVTSAVTVGNITERHEPTQSYVSGGQTVREWEIDKLTAFINEIWNVLTVELSKEGNPVSLSMGQLGAGYYMVGDEGQANTQLDNWYKDAIENPTYSGGGIMAFFGNDWFSHVDGAADVFMSGGRTIYAFRITINALDSDNLSPVTQATIYYRYYTSDKGDTLDKYYLPMTVVSLAGNFSFSAGVGIRTPLAANAGIGSLSVQLTAQELTAIVAASPLHYTAGGRFDNENGYSEHWSNVMYIDWTVDNVLLRYNFDLIPHSVWNRDGNWPVFVNTFDLPILPPYPNPPYWINPARMFFAFTNNNLSGNISNCTSVPSGRVVQYMFRLLTGGFNLTSGDAIDYWNETTVYQADDVAEYEGYAWTAINPYTGEYPGLYSGDWTKGDIIYGWSRILAYDKRTDYEYINESTNYYIQLITEIQNEVIYSLQLTTSVQAIQNYLWYYNLASWITEAKSYEADVTTYDDSKICLWGSSELVINEEELDVGVTVAREQQTAGDPPVGIDAYDITPDWNWAGNTAVDDELLTDNIALTYLCDIHEYEPTSLVWDDWTKTVVYTASNGESLTGLVITPTNYTSWVGIKVRATVTLTMGSVSHIFISGWALIVPTEGLEFS